MVGGNRLDCPDNTSSPAASLLQKKLLINSTILDAHLGARFMTMDLKDFFLATPMARSKYMRIHSKYFPPETKALYMIDSDGYVYVEINKGKNEFKQASVIAYQPLVKHLDGHGYYPVPFTTGIWSHQNLKTMLCICVDDFGINFFSQQDANHLLTALRQKYDVTVEWTGENYLGIDIGWEYQKGHVDISMPEYIPNAMIRLNHPAPKKPQYTPHRWTTPAYGQQLQIDPYPNSSEFIDQQGTKFIQNVVSIFLYYARALDPTMICALNEISCVQARPTKDTMAKAKCFLDYPINHA